MKYREILHHESALFAIKFEGGTILITSLLNKNN